MCTKTVGQYDIGHIMCTKIFDFISNLRMIFIPLHDNLNQYQFRNATFRDSIHWPEQDDGTHSKLSSFTFQRMFPQEAKPHSTTAASSPRYVQPQLCPIQVSISRNGKMYKLGSAHVFVSGEEGKNALQQPSIRNIPVVNFDNAFKNSMSMGIGGNHNNKAQLMRLRGDTLKCGLADGAALRVLVRVSDPAVDQIQDQAKANIMPKFQMTTDQSNYMNMLSPSSRMGIRIFDLTSNDDTPVMERNTTVLTVASTTRSVMSSDEASWEYDPSQSAVVIKKKKKTMMPRNNEIIKDTTMHSNLIGVDGARNKDGYTRTRSDTSASAASSDANTNDVSQSSSMASSSDAEDSRDVLSRFSYATDDCSLYSDSSSQLIKLINDISSKTRDRSNVTTDVMTMSSSVQSYQQRRRGGRTQHTSGTDTRAHHNAHNINVKGGDDATISTCSSGSSSSSNSSTSIASPPLIPRAADALRSAIFQRSSACTSSHHNDGRGSSSQGRSSPPSGVKHWTKRLICCGSIADEDGGECTFLSPIIDEDNSLDYDQTDYDYSLEGREWSDLELE